ncbi:uncharacterized protein [Mytilus edulis]|uniref:uncharacterized protein n=1 Tax=Mytilus edulis TaxID=6550 RepID=UPI0039EE9D83
MVTSEGGAFKEIRGRIGKARTAFLKLRHIWKFTNISKNTKIRLYNNCALAVLLYGTECWRMTEKDSNKLSSFLNGCIRKILRIFWPRKITNKDLHETTGPNNMETLLIKAKKIWRCIGHIRRRPAEDLNRVALRLTPEEKRKKRRPKATWRRTVEAEMKEHGISWVKIEKKAQNRDEWKDLVLIICASGHNKD